MPEPEPAGDAVTVDVVPGRPRRRRTGAIAIAVVALVAVGSGATWLVTRGDGGAAAGGICPATVPGTAPSLDGDSRPSFVPTDPTASGVDGRLVPGTAPTEVVLCEYHLPYGTFDRVPVPASPGVNLPYGSEAPGTPGAAPTDPGEVDDLPLGRTALHDGSAAAVASLVTTLQNATVRSGDSFDCFVGIPSGTPPQYLVRLSYDDGTVWVAGPDVCAGSTNGVATSDLDISEPVFAALNAPNGPPTVSSTAPSAVTVPLPPESAPVVPPASSTPGPEDDPLAGCVPADVPAPVDGDPFVPFEPTSLTVCHAPVEPGATITTREQPVDVAQDVATRINGLSTLEPTGQEQSCPANVGESWLLVFRSADARVVTVYVDTSGCPYVADGTHLAMLPDGLADLVRQID